MKKILAFVLILSILAVVPCALAANKSKTTGGGGGGSDYEWKPIPSGAVPPKNPESETPDADMFLH